MDYPVQTAELREMKAELNSSEQKINAHAGSWKMEETRMRTRKAATLSGVKAGRTRTRMTDLDSQKEHNLSLLARLAVSDKNIKEVEVMSKENKKNVEGQV